MKLINGERSLVVSDLAFIEEVVNVFAGCHSMFSVELLRADWLLRDRLIIDLWLAQKTMWSQHPRASILIVMPLII